MLRLSLGIGFGDQRTAQPVPGIDQAEEPLALAHTHLHSIPFQQTRRETLPIPQIGVHLGVRRRLADQSAYFLQLLGRQSSGSPGVVTFRQATQAFGVEAPHPIDQGARQQFSV